MRRQVKPFVTEYRGAPRRLKDQLSASDLPQDPQPAQHRARSYADAQRVFQPDPGEDSYEAALRAADALFATPSHREPPPARQPAYESPWSDEASAGSSPPVEESSTPSSSAELAGRDAGSSPSFSEPEAAPRRILQAIETSGEDRFAAMEAERAPKRRGRKPGSKNKPKPVPADDWVSSQPAAAIVAKTTPVERVAAPVRPALVVEPALLADDLVEEAEVSPAPVAPSRTRGERFGRKRAELRPGERWKRRLPKVAW